MSLRNLIKIQKSSLNTNVKRSQDNHYEYRLEILYGEKEKPYTESACFKKEEFDNWLINVEKLLNSIKGQLKDEEESRSGESVDCERIIL